MIINVTTRFNRQEGFLEVILSDPDSKKDARFKIPKSQVHPNIRVRDTRRSEIDLETQEGRAQAQQLAALVGRPSDALIG